MPTPPKVPVPVFRSHTWAQECQIAEGSHIPKPVPGYVFNNGKRKFDDQVTKKKSYD
jgi:hypothetical protein